MSTKIHTQTPRLALSPQACPERARVHRPHKSMGSSSHGPIVTPPISLPCAHRPSEAAHTRPVQKSKSIHTLNPSPSTIPQTSSDRHRQLPETASCSLVQPTIRDGHIHSSSSPSTVFSTRPELEISTAPEQSTPIILPPHRWDSLPSSAMTERATREPPQTHFLNTGHPYEEPLSPATAKRKQYSKLRRHLGASIPPELVYGEKGGVTIDPSINPIVEHPPEGEQDYTYLTVAPGPHEENESSEESESEESESEESGNGKMSDPGWSSPPSDPIREPSKHQYYGRWMREQGGRRWLVSNYREVIQSLREL
jgi:hypothetical protein